MLKQKFILTYGIGFISLLFGMASSIIIARIGGPNVIGTLAFGMAFVAVFQFVTDLGIGTAQQKLVTTTDEISDYVTTYAVLKVTTSFIFLIVIVSYYYLQVNYLGNHEIDKPEIRTIIFIYIAINFFDSISYIFRTNFIARTERAKVEIPTFVQTTLDKIARIVLIFIGYGAIALATSSLVFVILVLPINFFLFKNYKFGKFRRDLVKSYITISLPVIIILFAQRWIENIDRILLQKLHGTYEVGLYMAAFSLSVPVKLLGSSVGSLLFPSFSTLLYQKKPSEISDIMSRYRRYLVCIFLPFLILIVLFSSQIVLFLFGEKYNATVLYFPFILITLFINIYTLPYLNLAFAKGLFKQIAIISLFILAFEASLIYLLSAKSMLNLKGLGAAIALLITNIIIYIVYERLANKILKIEINKNIYLIIVIQIVLGVLAYFILKSEILGLYFIIPIFFLTIIFLIEWRIKIISKGDLKFFISIIQIKPIFNYIKNEINSDLPDETP